MFDKAIVDLYPKFEIGARPIKGTEVDEILKAANLNGLSPVFYDGDSGYGFVMRDGSRTVFSEQADTLGEVMNFLNREHEYGNRDTRTGKHLENYFGGLGYGWETEAVRLMLAVLFRAGKIDVQSESSRYDTYTDPRSREVFTNVPKFRRAVFTPRRPIDRKILTQAVETLEALAGETADVEVNDIYAKYREFASAEINWLQPLEVKARTNQLPVLSALESYREALVGGLKSADEAVNVLAGDGTSLRENRKRAHDAEVALSDESLNWINLARRALKAMLPILAGRGEDLQQIARDLEALLASEELVTSLDVVRRSADQIAQPYYELYARLHQERATGYAEVISDIQQMPEWTLIPEERRMALLRPLNRLAARKLPESRAIWSARPATPRCPD